MASMTINRTIHAPVEEVFGTIADIRRFSQAIPDIQSFEILGPEPLHIGSRFRETRSMGKREMTTELEITEYEQDRLVRMVADSHGTIWDTIFRVHPTAEGTALEMTMDARAYKLFPKIMNRLVHGMIRKNVAKDMDQLKAYCES